MLNDVCGAGAVQCFAFSLFPSATSVAATFPIRGRSSAAGGSLSVGAAQTLHREAESRTALPRCLPHQLRPPAAGGPHPSRCSAKAQHRATFPKGKAKHCHYHCTTPLQKCAATGVTPVHLYLTKKRLRFAEALLFALYLRSQSWWRRRFRRPHRHGMYRNLFRYIRRSRVRRRFPAERLRARPCRWAGGRSSR